MANKFHKGDKVKFNANGVMITRIVWDEDENRVYLCTEEAYSKSLTDRDAHVLPGIQSKDNVELA